MQVFYVIKMFSFQQKIVNLWLFIWTNVILNTVGEASPVTLLKKETLA